jgi:hypothetical protein
MGFVRVTTIAAAPPGTAERLWYDTTRWPSFIQGFRHVVELRGDWPATGARVVWDSSPQGRGRVVEEVTAYAPGQGQTLEVDDPRMRGTQRIAFATAADGGVELTLELDYVLKGDVPRPLRPIVDSLFVRRVQRDALRRTLDSFAIEVEAEVDLG